MHEFHKYDRTTNELNTAHKIGILARNVLYESLCRTE